MRLNLFWSSLYPSAIALPMGLLLQRDPPSSSDLPCMSWSAMMGSLLSLLFSRRDWTSSVFPHRAGSPALGSSILPSFGSSPVCLLHFWVVGTRTVHNQQGWGSCRWHYSPAWKPQWPSHNAVRTVIRSSVLDVTSLDAQSITYSLLALNLHLHFWQIFPSLRPHHHVSVETLFLCGCNYSLSFSLSCLWQVI